jgi:hypothetical protein
MKLLVLAGTLLVALSTSAGADANLNRSVSITIGPVPKIGDLLNSGCIYKGDFYSPGSFRCLSKDKSLVCKTTGNDKPYFWELYTIDITSSEYCKEQ